MNFEQVAANTDRQLGIARANLPRALVAAEESDRGLLSSAPMTERVAGGGGGSSSVERAALGRVSNRERRRLGEAARDVEAAAARFAAVVASLSELAPRARNCAKTGRVLESCRNLMGCPTSSDATREGLCEGCWHYQQHIGGWRTPESIEQQRLERRQQDAARKRASRDVANL